MIAAHILQNKQQVWGTSPASNPTFDKTSTSFKKALLELVSSLGSKDVIEALFDRRFAVLMNDVTKNAQEGISLFLGLPLDLLHCLMATATTGICLKLN